MVAGLGIASWQENYFTTEEKRRTTEGHGGRMMRFARSAHLLSPWLSVVKFRPASRV
jgi:hypothetical protein